MGHLNCKTCIHIIKSYTYLRYNKTLVIFTKFTIGKKNARGLLSYSSLRIRIFAISRCLHFLIRKCAIKLKFKAFQVKQLLKFSSIDPANFDKQ